MIGVQLDPSRFHPGDAAGRKREPARILDRARASLELDAVLVWAHGDPQSLEGIARYGAESGLATYLWFPVLADPPGVPVPEEAKVVNFLGRSGWGDIGRWEKLGAFASGDEKFEFVCPNQEETVERIFERYRDLVDRSGFDGVFLDRIRFPSPAVGFEMLYSCFCGQCRRRYQQETGSALAEHILRAASHVERLKTDPLPLLSGARALHEAVYPPPMQSFLDFRGRSVFRVVEKFASFARGKGKKVGLDLFSPSLAGLVSQEYRRLSAAADWIKPMFYCHTNGPAGVPLELRLLVSALRRLSPGLEERKALPLLGAMLQTPLPAGAGELEEKGVPEELIDSEMRLIERMSLPPGVRVYAGIEAMDLPGICTITGPILDRYVAAIGRSGAHGLIVSWNLMDMPAGNLRHLGALLKGRPA